MWSRGSGPWSASHAETVAANAQREAEKRQAKAATTYFLAPKRKVYVTASGYRDTAIGAVGENSDGARNFRRLRSRIRGLRRNH